MDFDKDDNNGNSGSPALTRRESMKAGIGAGLLALASTAPIAQGASGPRFRTVEITAGKIRGLVDDQVAKFKGIPYGANTGGSNRFRPPQPVPSWIGVRDALELGDQCPQVNLDPPVWNDISRASEDCLALNVWAPAGASSNSRLPVMVWLHGGGYTFGSAGAPLYDCTNIAREGNVVAVSINHRLNIFGYSYLGQDEQFQSSSNAGHLDIVAALRWVRDNIDTFGGDPANVTLFGQSGGGGKVSALLGMQAADDLFHKAIIQSGSGMYLREPADAEALTFQAYEILGLRQGDVLSLQSVSTAQLLACYKAINDKRVDFNPALRYGPTVDGHVFPSQPWLTGSPPHARHVPMIIGTNLDETAAFAGPVLRSLPNDDLGLAKIVQNYLFHRTLTVDETVFLIRQYRRLYPQMSSDELIVRVSTDVGFYKPALDTAQIRCEDGGAAVFMYECDWKTPCFGHRWAVHGVELPFVFGIDRYGSAWDGSDNETLRDKADPRGERFVVGRQMFGAWVRFARSGNPSSTSLNWPAYNVSDRPTMRFASGSQAQNDPRELDRRLVQTF